MTDLTFRKLFQEYKQSGLSVRDFCANQDFAVSTFYYWMKKHEKKRDAPLEFVPLMIKNQIPKNNDLQNPFPSVCSDGSGSNALLEFVFPNGTKMLLKENINIALLKAIVHLYD